MVQNFVCWHTAVECQECYLIVVTFHDVLTNTLIQQLSDIT